jgi:hypothetical protein
MENPMSAAAWTLLAVLTAVAIITAWAFRQEESREWQQRQKHIERELADYEARRRTIGVGPTLVPHTPLTEQQIVDRAARRRTP